MFAYPPVASDASARPVDQSTVEIVVRRAGWLGEGAEPEVTQAVPAQVAAGRARAAVAAAARGTWLTPEALDGLVLGVSEVVANALVHGTPPVRAVILAQRDLVEVRVSDAGPGPHHLDVAAAAGASPPVARDATGGRGLWLASHSCDEVEVATDGDGCTVRLAAHGAP